MPNRLSKQEWGFILLIWLLVSLPISSALAKRYQFIRWKKAPKASVNTVKQAPMISIEVLGAVTKPGTYSFAPGGR